MPELIEKILYNFLMVCSFLLYKVFFVSQDDAKDKKSFTFGQRAVSSFSFLPDNDYPFLFYTN
jgi:hypothetical protein